MMRSLFSIGYVLIGVLLCIQNGYLQNCTDHPFFQEGREIKYTELDKKNENSGYQIYQISNVRTSGSAYYSTLKYTMSDNSTIATGEVTCSCKNNKVLFPAFGYFNKKWESVDGGDTTKFILQFVSGTASEELLNIKVGDKLKNYEFVYKLFMDGTEGSLYNTVSNLRVVGKESISVSTFKGEAWKVIGDSKIVVKMNGREVQEIYKFEYYYSVTHGIVKRLGFDAEGKLSSSLILDYIK